MEFDEPEREDRKTDQKMGHIEEMPFCLDTPDQLFWDAVQIVWIFQLCDLPYERQKSRSHDESGLVPLTS